MLKRLVRPIQNELQKIFFKKALNKPIPTSLTHFPEPLHAGDYNRGIRYLSREYFDDFQIHIAPNGNIWDCAPDSGLMLQSFHAFLWMDDLAAVNTSQANRLMKEWLQSWLHRYRAGNGPGWTIETTSWRLLRLLTHATKIIGGLDEIGNHQYFQSISVHVQFIERFYKTQPMGIGRILPLTAWLYAALSIEGLDGHIPELIKKLDSECDNLLTDSAVKLPSRNPEELSEIFCLLVWADQALKGRQADSGQNHLDLIEMGGRAIRSLRMGNGNLLQAQGGGPGQIPVIETALAEAMVTGVENRLPILGFSPIRAGQLKIVMDTEGPYSEYDFAHASTLGLWVTEGRHRLIGNMGYTKNHNFNTRIQGQDARAHSTLILDGLSSSSFTMTASENETGFETTYGAKIKKASRVIDLNILEENEATVIESSQDGFVENYGLLHERKLSLDRDGLFFSGVDILRPENQKAELMTSKILKKLGTRGISFEIQFILGPKINPSLDMNSQVVSFKSPTGVTWIMRQNGAAVEIVDRSLYEAHKVSPTPIKAIILRSRLINTSGYISWSFQAYNH